MSVVEELQRLQRAAEVNNAQLQRLQHELQLLDSASEAKQQANRQHTAQTQEELRMLEASIAALSDIHRSTTTTASVKCTPSSTTKTTTTTPPPLSSGLFAQQCPSVVQHERLFSSMADLERQVGHLAMLQRYRQMLEDILRRGAAQHPEYKILGQFDSRNEVERVALARVMAGM